MCISQNLDNIPVETVQEPVAFKSNEKQETSVLSTNPDCIIPDERNTDCMKNCPVIMILFLLKLP